MRDWEGLEAFAKSKKSPIGYEVRAYASLVDEYIQVTACSPSSNTSSLPAIIARHSASFLVASNGIALSSTSSAVSGCGQLRSAKNAATEGDSCACPPLGLTVCQVQVLWYRELRQRCPNNLVGAQLDSMLEEMGGNSGF